LLSMEVTRFREAKQLAMAYKIVFFDIDGTLVNEQKIIPADTKEAVQKLKERGTDVVIATGRAPFHAYNISRELGIDSLICFNGSHVEYRGQMINRKHLSHESIKFLELMADEGGHPIVFFWS
jgi:HAD superfamily hydrolase (TIGR01484 family)